MKISHDSEVKAEGQQVITACAFIHQNINGAEKLFLPKRAMTKKFLPGKFELPGGHIDFGEDLVTGLKREIKEEFGVEIAVGDPFAAFTYHNEIKGSHSVEVVYFARFVSPLEEITINPEDHYEFIWLGEESLGEIVDYMGGVEDDEFKNIQKGFALLSGEKQNFC